jgi:UDP-3-O-[3-hydroxymyristoyl] glucosamine N-acyltransferase
MSRKSFSLEELAVLTAARLIGHPLHRISGVNSLDEAQVEDASFLANPRYSEAMKRSRAGVICIDPKTVPLEGKNFLVAEDPSRIFQTLIQLFSLQSESAFAGVHPTAVIDPSVELGVGVTVGPYAVLDRGVRVGNETKIGAHVFIGHDTYVGSGCRLDPLCVIREGCLVGDRVIVQSGAVIGSCGFGYVTDSSGQHRKLEQLGSVRIEDDVEIGANTTIDRSRFKETVIGRGSKIDNLVQIAHNVEIGPGNLIAAQTGIAGSAKTGHHVMLGGQVGVLGHIEIEAGTMVATRGGVSKSLSSGKYRGSPAIPLIEYNRQEVHIRRLKEYVERIKQLEEKVGELESRLAR